MPTTVSPPPIRFAAWTEAEAAPYPLEEALDEAAGPRPIILDCDPGHDDALALLLALARPEVRLLGVTTVAGNAPLAATTRNALAVLTLADRTDVPVAAGADRPLRRPLEVASVVHGPGGLEGADLPEPACEPVAEPAVEFIARTVESSAVPVTLVPTGPLTNVALFLSSYRRLAAEKVGGICLMGGAIGAGNWTASAEFNIWVDPEAAAIVFDSGLPIAMIGLDVTHQAIMTLADADRLAVLGNRTGAVFADLLRYFARYHRERYGWDGAPIHDAVAVAHVLGLGLVETRRGRVDVETVSELTRGRTVVDFEGRSGRPANAEVGVALDRRHFIELVIDAVRRFP
ncbi:MAG TPA: nucleoside hydrolase [Candidatus Binatia bacterium]|nr:nucleoside hydrolase [Candidatus Binatia bacterium]